MLRCACVDSYLLRIKVFFLLVCWNFALCTSLHLPFAPEFLFLLLSFCPALFIACRRELPSSSFPSNSTPEIYIVSFYSVPSTHQTPPNKKEHYNSHEARNIRLPLLPGPSNTPSKKMSM